MAEDLSQGAAQIPRHSRTPPPLFPFSPLDNAAVIPIRLKHFGSHCLPTGTDGRKHAVSLTVLIEGRSLMIIAIDD